MTWDVKETNTGRPLNDFTWFFIRITPFEDTVYRGFSDIYRVAY